MLANYGLNVKKLFPITKRTIVNVHQEKDNTIDFEKQLTSFNNDLRLKILENIYTKNEQVVQDRELKIQLLEKEIIRLSVKDTIPIKQINSEIKFHFSDVEKFAYAKITQVKTVNDSIVFDTIPTFLVNYNKNVNSRMKSEQKRKITDWLRLRFNNNKIEVVEY